MRLLLPAILILAGCGTSTERQAHRTQVETLVIPALTFTTPAGTVTSQPAVIQRKVESVEEETEKKTLDTPNPALAILAAAEGSPWGSVINVALGLVAAFTGKKALDGSARTKKLVKAQSEFADDLEEAETNDDVAAVKAKHAAKQKSLGIYDDLNKARHA